VTVGVEVGVGAAVSVAAALCVARKLRRSADGVKGARVAGGDTAAGWFGFRAVHPAADEPSNRRIASARRRAVRDHSEQELRIRAV
jgi:hypothetical protein